MLKYINPIKYYSKARRVILNHKYDFQAEDRELRRVFSAADLDFNGAVEKLKSLSRYDEVLACNSMASNHWLIFAALSLKEEIQNILEIGTFDGKTTVLFTDLFPNAKIITVDLPDDDPIFTGSYGRDISSERRSFIEGRDRRLSLKKHISFIRSSSFFIMDKIGRDQKFDLVWVDGAHNFPEVSWDICNGYHLVKSGGVLMCDDVILSLSGFRDDYVSPDSYRVINHLAARSEDDQILYFLKRNSAVWSSDPKKKKYVAMIRKKNER